MCLVQLEPQFEQLTTGGKERAVRQVLSARALKQVAVGTVLAFVAFYGSRLLS